MKPSPSISSRAAERRSIVRDERVLRVAEAARRARAEVGVGGVVAGEAAPLPWLVADALAERGARVVTIDRELDRARATKTAAEIERLRFCAALTDLGQRAALEGARPGRSELEIWAEVRLAMELTAGER